GVRVRMGGGRAYTRLGELARAPWLLCWPVDKVDGHLRYLRKLEDWIARPIDARHPRAIELQLLEQCAAGGLHDVPFDLVSEAVGIDDLAAVVSDIEFLGGHLPRR